MPFLFYPPTVSEGPIGEHRLFQFFTLDRGITVVRDGSSFYEVRYPSEDELRGADEYWIGGCVHTVSDDTADLLTAAGYGDRLVEV